MNINKIVLLIPRPLRKLMMAIWQMFKFVNFKILYQLDYKRKIIKQSSLYSAAEYFNKKQRPYFFCDFERVNWRAFETNVIIQAAEKISSHIIDLLGSGEVNLGREINWHQDFISGYTWPKKYAPSIAYDFSTGADIKVPWELSRLQHLVILGLAYRITNRKKYVQEYINQVKHWIADNPVNVGVNWKCTMEVAIRACNLIFSGYLFKNSKLIKNDFNFLWLRSLNEHGLFIYRHLELNHLANSNHLVSDIVGLIYLGLLFPEFTEAKKWLDKGIYFLENEMGEQIHPDGVDYENSLSYHRLVLELFSCAALLCKRNNIPLSSSFWAKLEKMFIFTAYYLKPDGLAPQIGDNDDGRLHILSNYFGWNKQDHRYLLSLGQYLFPHNSLFAEYNLPFFEETYLLIPEAFASRQVNNIQILESMSFPDSGFYILRNKNIYCLVKAGNLGLKGLGGHDHNDLFSFVLNVKAKDFIIDPGTYNYTAYPALRNLFRSVKMHNTLSMNDREIYSIPADNLFKLDNTAKITHLNWTSNKKSDILEASHDGFFSLPSQVVSKRSFIFDKENGILKIVDTLSGNGNCQIKLSYVLSPKVRAESMAKGKILLVSEGVNIIFEYDPNLRLNLEDCEVSPSYGLKVKSQKIVLTMTVNQGSSEKNFTSRFYLK